MKTLLSLAFVLLAFGFGDAPSTSAINTLKGKAEAAYTAGDYQAAILHYSTLVDSLGMDSPEATLNLAHAYFQTQDTENATKYYTLATTSDNKQINSIAYQQLGVMEASKNKENAKKYFKQALRQNPYNEEARYNYEMLMQNEDQQDQQNQENQDNKDQDEKEENNEEEKDGEQENDKQDGSEGEEQNKEEEQENQENKNEEGKEGEENNEEQESSGEEKSEEETEQEGKSGESSDEQKEGKEQEEGDQESSEQERMSEEERKAQEDAARQAAKQQRLQEINMSEDKARMILEAMKNSEIQYYQQMKRQSQKKNDSSKPDW